PGSVIRKQRFGRPDRALHVDLRGEEVGRVDCCAAVWAAADAVGVEEELGRLAEVDLVEVAPSGHSIPERVYYGKHIPPPGERSLGVHVTGPDLQQLAPVVGPSQPGELVPTGV